MNKKLIELANSCGLEPAAVLAFIAVETGGKGFDDQTGKIIIQFEPAWFRKKAPYAPSGLWSLNKVDVQKKEWLAFNDAFAKNPGAAMLSTSIGLGQIMGFNFNRIGYNSVNEMWDDAKTGIDAQFRQLIYFIKSDSTLLNALKEHRWSLVATLYNGPYYKDIAKKYGRKPYDVSLSESFLEFSKPNF